MAILRDIAPQRQRTSFPTADPGPPGRGRRLRGDEIMNPSNTLRAPYGLPPAAPIRQRVENLPGQYNVVQAHPGSGFGLGGSGSRRGLRYANINGMSVLLPPGVGGEPGSGNVTGALQDFADTRAEQARANRPSEEELAQRRADYGVRAESRRNSLQEGRLARLAQQQMLSGQPVTPIAAEALQGASLGLAGNQGHFDRQQSMLNSKTEADTIGTLGRAQIGVDVQRMQSLLPNELDRERQFGNLQAELETGRLRSLAAPDVLKAQRAIQGAGVDIRLDEARRMGKLQRKMDRKDALGAQNLQVELQRLQQQSQPLPQPDWNDPNAVGEYLETQEFRQTPEQFGEQLRIDPNMNHSRLRDLYEELEDSNDTWFGDWYLTNKGRREADRRKRLQEYLGRALGVQGQQPAPSAAQPPVAPPAPARAYYPPSMPYSPPAPQVDEPEPIGSQLGAFRRQPRQRLPYSSAFIKRGGEL